MTLPTTLPVLHIQHNHGGITLRDVTLVPDTGKGREGCRFALGTVVNGGTTSRLFQHSVTRYETPGEEKTVDIWNRHIYPVWNQEGHYRVDLSFC